MTAPAAALHELRLFFVALQFLTRIPAPRWVGYEPHWLNACVRHFPVAGAVIGGCAAAVLWAAQWLWSPWVAALLAVTATVWLTAAFHEDGLADTFDALLGSAPRDKALAIMKDSRIGSYGAAALFVVLGLRVALVADALRHGAAFAACALLASHVLGRAGAVALMALLPYAGDADHAKAKPLAREVRPRDALLAAGWCLPLLASMPDPLAALGSAAAVAGVVIAMRRWLARRLGGYTGDTLGAAEQLGAVAVLLALTLR
jgi:adenosylcobinamide-GDP ribazoletransferase